MSQIQTGALTTLLPTIGVDASFIVTLAIMDVVGTQEGRVLNSGPGKCGPSFLLFSICVDIERKLSLD